MDGRHLEHAEIDVQTGHEQGGEPHDLPYLSSTIWNRTGSPGRPGTRATISSSRAFGAATVIRQNQVTTPRYW